jgi:hypothetical protein
MQKIVNVTGDADALWQTLLGTLYAHEYEIEAQNPYTQLTAKRGSKVSSLILEGTKSGFRQLNVTFVPREGKETEVRFQFDFPSWAITLPATKQECDELVDEFVRQAGQGAEPGQAAAGAVPSGQTRYCPSCGVEVAQGAKFCNSCGAALTAKTCAKCGAAVRPEAKFCDNCGAHT